MKNKKVNDYCSHCGATSDLVKSNYVIRKDGTEKQYYWCNPCNTERMKRYYHTKKGDAIMRKTIYKSIKNNWGHMLARQRVRYYIKTGRLVRPTKCSSCGKGGKIQAHHKDYTKPMKVVWLCLKCHAAADRKLS